MTPMKSRPRASKTAMITAVGVLAALLLAGTVSGPGVAAPILPMTESHHADSMRSDVGTGLIATPLARPHPVVAADGRRHLAYELQLINVTAAAVTVHAVETLDEATGRVLAALTEDRVGALLTTFAGASGTTLAAGSAGFILMDVALPTTAKVPARLVHRFRLSYEPDLGLSANERSGVTSVVRDRPVLIGSPLTGTRWIALNGCCGPTSHRQAVNPINGALYVAERFAIDFARLDAQGRGYHGDPALLSSYPSYGADVRSVAAGVVVGTHDGIADNVPVGSLPPIFLNTVAGNYVVLRIGPGHFALYAHLQPHSLKVKPGDRVRRGQRLGLLGNSGNSDFPHLHFQIMNSRSPLASDGLPYEFSSFHSEGLLANLDQVAAGGTASFDPTLSGTHVRQIPLELQSVDFS
jgi:hypothetical protein